MCDWKMWNSPSGCCLEHQSHCSAESPATQTHTHTPISYWQNSSDWSIHPLIDLMIWPAHFHLSGFLPNKLIDWHFTIVMFSPRWILTGRLPGTRGCDWCIYLPAILWRHAPLDSDDVLLRDKREHRHQNTLVVAFCLFLILILNEGQNYMQIN